MSARHRSAVAVHTLGGGCEVAEGTGGGDGGLKRSSTLPAGRRDLYGWKAKQRRRSELEHLQVHKLIMHTYLNVCFITVNIM